MDTRQKIISVAVAENLWKQFPEPPRIVVGAFDPLLSSHAGRLESAKETDRDLWVVLMELPRPLLPAGARAELVAAVEVVDAVVLGDARDVERWLAGIPAGMIVDERGADASDRERLIHRVQDRHSLEPVGR